MSIREIEYADYLHKPPIFGCDCGQTQTISYDNNCWWPICHGEDMGAMVCEMLATIHPETTPPRGYERVLMPNVHAVAVAVYRKHHAEAHAKFAREAANHE